ncbi:hypothetical protein [Streptomyces sp. NPDC048155]|uniref:hypothetical protein n=1 Tax=Streptomyces sp. NPDC048155 TaxID=3154818 RepID=UPI0033C47E64
MAAFSCADREFADELLPTLPGGRAIRWTAAEAKRMVFSRPRFPVARLRFISEGGTGAPGALQEGGSTWRSDVDRLRARSGRTRAATPSAG